MKKKTNNTNRIEDDLLAEYDLDYSKSRPNRFAADFASGGVAVVLEPDIAAVFRSSKSVNAALRSIITARPGRKKQRRAG